MSEKILVSKIRETKGTVVYGNFEDPADLTLRGVYMPRGLLNKLGGAPQELMITIEFVAKAAAEAIT